MNHHTIVCTAGRDQRTYDALLDLGALIITQTFTDLDYVPLREIVALGDEASLLEYVEHHLATLYIEETCNVPPFLRRLLAINGR